MICCARPRNCCGGETVIGSHRLLLRLLGCGLLLGWPAIPAPVKAEPWRLGHEPTGWRWDLTAGFDSYRHTYALATVDTTETISELMVQAGLERRSVRRARHRWRVRAEASAGSELFRERFDGGYGYRDTRNIERIRLNGRFSGRQYRQTTDYSRSSDYREGRFDGRVTPWSAGRGQLQLRGWLERLDYDTPSTLEVSQRERGVGVVGRSTGFGDTMWELGVRRAKRAYPDSSAIDRDTWSVAGELDHQVFGGNGLRLYHKSERRRLRDEAVRPAAWTHWTDARGTLRLGPGQMFLTGQAEVWRYDQQNEVYFNSTRWEGTTGYKWGDLLAVVWQLGLAGEIFDAGTSPESYRQYGVRGGAESYGAVASVALTVEYGHRQYRQGIVELPSATAGGFSQDLLYSGFYYWKTWLTASWRISPRFDLDAIANYEPERHAERSDDMALGMVSVRVRWRH